MRDSSVRTHRDSNSLFLLRAKRANPDDVLRTFAVTLVIIGSLFAMTAGFSSAQIAPIVGLFGTIIGYITGRRTADDDLDVPHRPPVNQRKNKSEGRVAGVRTDHRC